MQGQELQAELVANVRTIEIKRYPTSNCVEKCSHALIRPPRFLYNEDILNPRRKHGNRFKHSVFFIPFPLSLYTPKNMKYVVLYLHGNSSSRYEGFNHLPNLPLDVGLACFDFDGCGLRTGRRYISLGKHEAVEVDIAVRFLRGRGLTVVGWGRSMGAVSLLLSSECQVMVADSPFASLRAVCREVAVPVCPMVCRCFFHCLFPCFFSLICRDVEKKSQMHPEQLEIIQHIRTSQAKQSIIFLAAYDDTVILPTHSQMLFDSYKGVKKLLTFEGTHNSTRQPEVILETFIFIEEQLGIFAEKAADCSGDRPDGLAFNSYETIVNPTEQTEEIKIKKSSLTRVSDQTELLRSGQASENI